MPYTSITKPSIGEPTKKSIIDALIDNDEFFNGNISVSSRINMIPNGSFEEITGTLPLKWTVTNYSGGSSAVNSSNNTDGQYSMSFTSTSVTNGGGYADTEDYIPVIGGQYYYISTYLRSNNSAGISSRVEARWYDSSKTFISSSTVIDYTATPTSFTLVETQVQAPSTARFVIIRIIGGVPGVGTAVGTIYFDSVVMMRAQSAKMIGANVITQNEIANAAIGQGELKTVTASQSQSIGPQTLYDFSPTGGDYTIFYTLGGSTTSAPDIHHSGNSSASTYSSNIGVYNSNSGSDRTVYLHSRYVQASPPYNYGAGDVPLFVLAMLDKTTRVVLATYVAEDPPWAYHGPHVLHPVIGKLQKYVGIWGKDPRKVWAGQDVMTRAEYLAALRRLRTLSPGERTAALAQPFTMAEKMADMDLVPHLFSDFDPAKHVVVQIDPLTSLCEDLHCLMMTPDAPSPSELLHDGSIKIGSEIKGARIQRGVLLVNGKLK